MEQDDLIETGESATGPHWLRILFVVGYFCLGGIAFVLATLLGLAQEITHWIRKRPHEGLDASAALLARYASDCLDYIALAGDWSRQSGGGRREKPFPLGPLPRE